MIALLENFCRGATAMGFLVAAAFFFRFWRRTGDRLFVFFSAAFLLLTVNRVLLVIASNSEGENLAPYLIRLLAFVTIAGAVADKNFRRV
jgi:hypothetical protein